MTKPNRLSISTAMPPEEEDVATPQRDEVATLQRHDVAVPKMKATKTRSHSSFYVSPKVLKTLRELALKRDCKVNDLICEGIRRVLAENGRDFDRLNR